MTPMLDTNHLVFRLFLDPRNKTYDENLTLQALCNETWFYIENKTKTNL